VFGNDLNEVRNTFKPRRPKRMATTRLLRRSAENMLLFPAV
jgi:hypothetical protein